VTGKPETKIINPTRIDLTQFEGIREGEHPKHLFEEVEMRFDDGGVKTQPLYLNEAYVNAITMLPELIAELKKMYEMQDEAVEYVSYLTSTPDVLTRFKDMPAQAMTINNLRHSLEGLLTRLGADPQSGFGSNAEVASE
jgi:hypothetical protein